MTTISVTNPGAANSSSYFDVTISGDDRLVDFVRVLLISTAVSPQCVCFEVTETAAINRLAVARKVITELREHTYFAKLRIRHNGELHDVDSRPSDAIAVAVTCDPPLPIFVNEEVLEEAME